MDDDESLTVTLGHQILAEVRALRQEMASALAGIRAVVEELHRVERAETEIEAGLQDVSRRLGASVSETECASCGSAVERHSAPNGLLLICKACGRSSFLDRRSGPERRQAFASQPLEGAPAPPADALDGWTGK